MMSRGRIIISQDAFAVSLEQRVLEAERDRSAAAAMKKDCHLLEAALSTDQCIISLDDKARNHFRRLCSRLPEIRSICWVNPCTPEEKAVAWLEAGAPAERVRLLGSPSQRPEK